MTIGRAMLYESTSLSLACLEILFLLAAYVTTRIFTLELSNMLGT